ncbi:trypsin-like peptidase domain-containing protein [uncultured Streptomyces sp.]|uniref:trypsin-like peptidase domain-containing protein n=1 Tax=uncultured Streptomyces sp. TaxID=174707 RepID=UPI00262EAD87|nr:trypsin-like peptidase domain-containing protein [uncultured Streptomyces sp.]
MGSGDRSKLVRICDEAGRPRGTGFVADDRGTVVTSHQVLLTASGLVLHGPDGRTRPVPPDEITALPALGLALLATDDPDALGVAPLPVASRERTEPGGYVRIAAHGWRQGRVLGTTPAVYTERGRAHPVPAALELALGTDARDALRSGGAAVGGPVTDPATGAVLGVLSTALHAPHEAGGLAVPLAPGDGGPLDALLRRNALCAPAYGPDLNLAGALQLTATSVGAAEAGAPGVAPVERAAVRAECAAFAAGPAAVLGIVGAPGTGRTTELAALAARRAQGPAPAPTLWLRGADLLPEDGSVADAVARTLERSARIVAADGGPGGAATAPERLAALAAGCGSPLLVVLDGPEEMPPVLAHRLDEWTPATAAWLRAHEVRLVVACRPEHWETAGALYPPDALHRPARPARGLPPALRLTDLTARQAAEARERHGLPDGALAPGHDRHPLTLRLLSEVRAALPPDVPGSPTTEDVFGAHLDLACLRIAVRIALAADAGPRPRGGAVRRLAARVAGQVHEAARRCLGPGQGELDRAAFEELFPWRTGWASAVLAEGLLAPAGEGYRFAHEEVGDWVQGAHLDLDAALHSLVHRRHADGEPPGPPDPAAAPRSLPVPRHRAGPVVHAMLVLGRRHGPAALAHRTADLIEALDRLTAPAAAARREEPGHRDAVWWAAHLLREALLRVADARPYLGVLRVLAGRITRYAAGDADPRTPGPYAGFGPWFWLRLRLPEADRLDLLRRLVPADGVDRPDGVERYLDAVAHRLTVAPAVVQPLLCGWFTDERPLLAAAGDGAGGTEDGVRPTVAAAAQALLYARRDVAVDGLTEVLVATGHPRAAELLTALAEDAPSALCRAVHRWARDEDRPERRAAAARYALLAAGSATGARDRELLRSTALALLARPGDAALRGAAFTLLARDPDSRDRWLSSALGAFGAGEPGLPVALLAEFFTERPDAALAALRARLLRPGSDAGRVLRELAALDAPALALHAAGLVREFVAAHPDGAADAAAYVGLRLERGPAARALLTPLVVGLLRERPAPPPVRAELARVLAGPGSPAARTARAELLEVLLDFEQTTGGHPDVLEALLRAAATGAADRPEVRTRTLVHRTGMLLVRTPEGATRFDRALLELARDVPGFALLVTRWLADAPDEWAVVVGPSTRRTLESRVAERVPTTVPMQAAGRAHGSLRPA